MATLVGLLWVGLLGASPAGAVPAACLTLAADADDIRDAWAAIEAQCPCAQFDGGAGNGQRAYKRCAKGALGDLVTAGSLRAPCRAQVQRMATKSTCGFLQSDHAAVCVRTDLSNGVISCSIRAPGSLCRSTAGIDKEHKCARATHCIEAADTNGDLRIAAPADSGKCAPLVAPTPRPTPVMTNPGPYPTGLGGMVLAQLLNAYRIANGKKALPLSPALMATAGAHVADLTLHPGTDSGVCTPHSWSKQGGLLWTGCCYTADHAQADCMWRKPREISTGLGLTTYPGAGYEIALRGTVEGTPEQVLEVFIGSAPHRAVMLSRDGWEFLDLHPAMGAAMRGGYAVVWFGDATDPN